MNEKHEGELAKFNDPEAVKNRLEFYSDFDPITNSKGMIVDIGYSKIKIEVTGFPWLVQVKKKKKRNYLYRDYFVLETVNIGMDEEFNLPNSYYILAPSNYKGINGSKYIIIGIDIFNKDFKILHKNVNIYTPGLENTIGYVSIEKDEV